MILDRPQNRTAAANAWRAAMATLMGGSLLLLGGCAERKRPALPWTTAVQVRPISGHVSSPSEEQAAMLPDLQIESPNIPILSMNRSSPPRPRVAPSANANSEAEKPESLVIAPQLAPREMASAQQEINASLSIAERNLERASGKTLNSTQADLVSKVRGFASDAREAGKLADWTRARNLAKKAQVLSEELAKSL